MKPLFMKLGLIVTIVIFITMLLVTLKLDIGERLLTGYVIDVSESVSNIGLTISQQHYNSSFAFNDNDTVLFNTTTTNTTTTTATTNITATTTTTTTATTTTAAATTTTVDKHAVSKNSSNLTSFEEWIDPTVCKCKSGEVCFGGSKGDACKHRSAVANLVLIVDENVVSGLITTMHSIINHTKTYLKIIVVTNSQDYAEVQGKIDCLPLPKSMTMTVIVFNLPSYIRNLIKVYSSTHQYLDKPGNFARLFLANVLVKTDYILYVDCDVIVRGDLGDLWKQVHQSNELLAAATFQRFKPSQSVLDLFFTRHGRNITVNAKTINNGVLGMNLKKWRKDDVKKEVLFWMAANKKKRLWSLGSQPIMNILAYSEDLKPLQGSVWNYRLWAHYKLSPTAKIIHVNGQCKPWLDDCKMPKGREAWKALWKEYERGLCSSNGECILANNTGTCQCNGSHSGHYCEK